MGFVIVDIAVAVSTLMLIALAGEACAPGEQPENGPSGEFNAGRVLQLAVSVAADEHGIAGFNREFGVTTMSQVVTIRAHHHGHSWTPSPRSVGIDRPGETPLDALNRLPKLNTRVRFPSSAPLF